MDLTKQKCVPCEGGVDALKREEFSVYLDQVNDWSVMEDKLLKRNFKFKNFDEAIKFVNRVAEIAEDEGHHPDIFLHNWNKLEITLSTHAIGGLSINDFVLASKIDKVV